MDSGYGTCLREISFVRKQKPARLCFVKWTDTASEYVCYEVLPALPSLGKLHIFPNAKLSFLFIFVNRNEGLILRL